MGLNMEKEKEMVELKPCPFCGSKARLVVLEYENSDTTRWHKIMCEDVFGCGAEIGTAISAWQADYKEAVQGLKDRWNRRYESLE